MSLAKGGAPEPECKICYEAFDVRARRPKLLACRHRVCARCLRQMAEAAQGSLSCPFCRRETPLPGKDVGRLPDDRAALALLGRRRRRRPGPAAEVLLCPGAIPEALAGGRRGPSAAASPSSSDCLVVTLLEVPDGNAAAAAAAAAAPGGLLEVMRLYRRASLASVRCDSPLGKRSPRPARAGAWRALARFLLALVALLYLCSLPLGIYLLLVERLHLGIALASLAPASLLLCLLFSLCRCLWQDVRRLPLWGAAAAAAAAAAGRPPLRQLPPPPSSSSSSSSSGESRDSARV